MNQIILALALISGLFYISHYIFCAFIESREEIVDIEINNINTKVTLPKLNFLNKAKKRKDDYLYNIVNLRKIGKTKTSFNIPKGKISIKV